MLVNTITKQIVKAYPELIFIRIDKGNTTVALDKIDYINRVENMFEDPDTHIYKY